MRSVAAMSSRASWEHTIFAEMEGVDWARSHDAFSNGLVVDVGDWAPELLLPHALKARRATIPHAAIDRVRTTERY
jgi:hypothetical protein